MEGVVACAPHRRTVVTRELAIGAGRGSSTVKHAGVSLSLSSPPRRTRPGAGLRPFRLSDQHASNAFLHIEQSASIFHDQTATACHFLIVNFIEPNRATHTSREGREGREGKPGDTGERAAMRQQGSGARLPVCCRLCRSSEPWLVLSFGA